LGEIVNALEAVDETVDDDVTVPVTHCVIDCRTDALINPTVELAIEERDGVALPDGHALTDVEPTGERVLAPLAVVIVLALGHAVTLLLGSGDADAAAERECDGDAVVLKETSGDAVPAPALADSRPDVETELVLDGVTSAERVAVIDALGHPLVEDVRVPKGPVTLGTLLIDGDAVLVVEVVPDADARALAESLLTVAAELPLDENEGDRVDTPVGDPDAVLEGDDDTLGDAVADFEFRIAGDADAALDDDGLFPDAEGERDPESVPEGDGVDDGERLAVLEVLGDAVMRTDAVDDGLAETVLSADRDTPALADAATDRELLEEALGDPLTLAERATDLLAPDERVELDEPVVDGEILGEFVAPPRLADGVALTLTVRVVDDDADAQRLVVTDCDGDRVKEPLDDSLAVDVVVRLATSDALAAAVSVDVVVDDTQRLLDTVTLPERDDDTDAVDDSVTRTQTDGLAIAVPDAERDAETHDDTVRVIVGDADEDTVEEELAVIGADCVTLREREGDAVYDGLADGDDICDDASRTRELRDKRVRRARNRAPISTAAQCTRACVCVLCACASHHYLSAM
jgi:hypothetical protein